MDWSGKERILENISIKRKGFLPEIRKKMKRASFMLWLHTHAHTHFWKSISTFFGALKQKCYQISQYYFCHSLWGSVCGSVGCSKLPYLIIAACTEPSSVTLLTEIGRGASNTGNAVPRFNDDKAFQRDNRSRAYTDISSLGQPGSILRSFSLKKDRDGKPKKKVLFPNTYKRGLSWPGTPWAYSRC